MDDTDLLLKLDPLDHSAMLAARIAERDATIVAKNAARKQVRALAAGKAADATKAAGDKTAALATAATQEAAFAAAAVAAKVKHAAAGLAPTDEGHDISTGTWQMRFKPRLSGLGPIIDRRLPLTDADCDAWVASYRLSVRAWFEAQDAQRQVAEYEAAHPKVDGEPGGLIPEPQALQDLRAALAGKLDTMKTEQAKQAAIVSAVLTAAGVKVDDYSYQKVINTETGEIVLGRNPMLTLNDKVIEAPASGHG